MVLKEETDFFDTRVYIYWSKKEQDGELIDYSVGRSPGLEVYILYFLENFSFLFYVVFIC